MINRVTGPEIKSISNLQFPKYRTIKLDNGICIYIIDGGTQEIFRIQTLYSAGRKYEKKRAVARLCNGLMRESNEKYNSNELAEQWDYYGAILRSTCNLDNAGHSLTGMNKDANTLIPLWFDTIFDGRFTEKELSIQKNLKAERLKIELVKNDVIAFRTFTESLYGTEHFYGYNTNPADYLNVSLTDLVDFHNLHYANGPTNVVLSGKISSDIESLVVGYLENFKTKPVQESFVEIGPSNYSKDIRIGSSNDLQGAIKMGNITISRSNPDFPAFSILVSVLGGFFGSRLMKSLREEKGLCYNIYSGIDRMMHSAFFYISAEVNVSNIDQAIDEIKKEINILQTTPLALDELEMVKNYLKGNILASLDGPFRSSQILKSYLSQNLSFDYFRQFVDELENITSKKLREVACKYLLPDEMTILIVGAK